MCLSIVVIRRSIRIGFTLRETNHILQCRRCLLKVKHANHNGTAGGRKSENQ